MTAFHAFHASHSMLHLPFRLAQGVRYLPIAISLTGATLVSRKQVHPLSIEDKCGSWIAKTIMDRGCTRTSQWRLSRLLFQYLAATGKQAVYENSEEQTQ